jgi:hypothetical protein
VRIVRLVDAERRGGVVGRDVLIGLQLVAGLGAQR